jgi:hypothetical protein
MDAISGNVIKAVHNVASPYAAPACEYVAMPDGSSSLEPVTSPGPSFLQNRTNLFFFFIFPIERSDDRL